MTAVCEVTGPRYEIPGSKFEIPGPKFEIPAGNWIARHLRLVNEDTRQIFPPSAARARQDRGDKFKSLYSVDFTRHPTEAFLAKSAQQDLPRRVTIRDALFGNSPSLAFQNWQVPTRLLAQSTSAPVKDKTARHDPAVADSASEKKGHIRPVLDRQKSLPALPVSAPNQSSSTHRDAPAAVGSLAPPIRSKTVPLASPVRSKTDAGGIKSSGAELPRSHLPPKSDNSANNWLKQSALPDRKAIERILRGQARRQQLDSALNKILLPGVRKRVQKWLEGASESERRVAVKFFSSMAAARLMGSTAEEQSAKLQQILHTLEKSAPQPQKSKESPVKGKESKLKYIQLLDPETRANRWMHTTWHHLPEYKDDNPVNNWSSHYTRPHAPTPRHYVIHPDWS